MSWWGRSFLGQIAAIWQLQCSSWIKSLNVTPIEAAYVLGRGRGTTVDVKGIYWANEDPIWCEFAYTTISTMKHSSYCTSTCKSKSVNCSLPIVCRSIINLCRYCMVLHGLVAIASRIWFFGIDVLGWSGCYHNWDLKKYASCTIMWYVKSQLWLDSFHLAFTAFWDMYHMSSAIFAGSVWGNDGNCELALEVCRSWVPSKRSHVKKAWCRMMLRPKILGRGWLVRVRRDGFFRYLAPDHGFKSWSQQPGMYQQLWANCAQHFAKDWHLALFLKGKFEVPEKSQKSVPLCTTPLDTRHHFLQGFNCGTVLNSPQVTGQTSYYCSPVTNIMIIRSIHF